MDKFTAPYGAVGPAFNFEPDGYAFARPVTITVPFETYAFEKESLMESGARVAVFHNSKWNVIEDSIPNIFDEYVSCQTEHFSVYQAIQGNESYASTYALIAQNIAGNDTQGTPGAIDDYDRPNIAQWTHSQFDDYDSVTWSGWDLEGLAVSFLTDYNMPAQHQKLAQNQTKRFKVGRATVFLSLRLLTQEAMNYRLNEFCEFPDQRSYGGSSNCNTTQSESNAAAVRTWYGTNPITSPTMEFRGWGLRFPSNNEEAYINGTWGAPIRPFTIFANQTGIVLRALQSAERLFRVLAILDPNSDEFPSKLVANISNVTPDNPIAVKIIDPWAEMRYFPLATTVFTWTSYADLISTYTARVVDDWYNREALKADSARAYSYFLYLRTNQIVRHKSELQRSYKIFIPNQSNMIAEAVWLEGKKRSIRIYMDTAGRSYNSWEYAGRLIGSSWHPGLFSNVENRHFGYTFNPDPYLWTYSYITDGNSVYNGSPSSRKDEDWDHANQTLMASALMLGSSYWNDQVFTSLGGASYASYSATQILQAFRVCYKADLQVSSSYHPKSGRLMTAIQKSNGIVFNPDQIENFCHNPRLSQIGVVPEAGTIGQYRAKLLTYTRKRNQPPDFNVGSYGLVHGWATISIKDRLVAQVLMHWADGNIAHNTSSVVQPYNLPQRQFVRARLGGGPYFNAHAKLMHTYGSFVKYGETAGRPITF